MDAPAFDATRFVRLALRSIALYFLIFNPAMAVDPLTVPPTSGQLTYYGTGSGFLCYYDGTSPVGSDEGAVALATARVWSYSIIGFAKQGSGIYDGKHYSWYMDVPHAYPYNTTYTVAQYVCPEGSKNASPPAYNCGGMPNARNNPNECCPCGYIYDSGQGMCVLSNTAACTQCPAHASRTSPGAPCTCDVGYKFDAAGTSCVLEQYTISIQPAPTNNGAYTILPSTALPLEAVVTDQNGVVQAGKQVTLTVDVQGGSGGHDHNENRPKGIFTCGSMGTSWTCTLTTGYNGQAPFIFVSTPVSGVHTITAACSGCGNTATAPVNVKVDNLIPIPASPLYALQDSTGAVIGAISGKHTANHYLTATAIGRLNALARLYKTSINPNKILYLNDASLVWGGLFDVGNTPWMSPHSLHDTGVSLDIRAANSGPNNEGAVPDTVFSEFFIQTNKKNIKAALHCNGSTVTAVCFGIPYNRHIHVDF